MIMFYNGIFVNESEKDFFPHSFDSMQGFFTTLKFANNKIYFLDLHTDRLRKTAEYLNFDFPEHNFEYIIRHLVLVNNLKTAKVKILVYNPWSIKCMVTVSEVKKFKKDVSLKSKAVYRGNDDFRYKLLQFMENRRYQDLAESKGYDDFLFIDEKGFILESTFANVFFVYENRVFTPPLSQPILPGIIRQVLMQNNLLDDYRFIQKKIHYSELKNFDAAFITNSIKGIVPVKQIDNFSYSTKKVSVLSNRLDI